MDTEPATRKGVKHVHAMLQFLLIKFLHCHNQGLLGKLQACRVGDQVSRWVGRALTIEVDNAQVVVFNLDCQFYAIALNQQPCTVNL